MLSFHTSRPFYHNIANRIKGFEYDGTGPDTFFWAGTSGEPSRVGILLPFPFDGKFYDYEDSSAPVLGRFEGVSEQLGRCRIISTG